MKVLVTSYEISYIPRANEDFIRDVIIAAQAACSKCVTSSLVMMDATPVILLII